MRKTLFPALFVAILFAGAAVPDWAPFTTPAWADDGDGGDGDGGDGGDGDGGDGGDGDGGDGDGGDGSDSDGDGDSDGDDGDNDSDDSDDSDTDDSRGDEGDAAEGAGGRDGGGDNPISALIDLVFGSDRDVVPNELIALTTAALTPAQVAALQAGGFAILEDTPLDALQSRALRIAVPPALDLDDAEEAVRTILPGAIVDQNDLYDLAGIGCDDECWAASLVSLAPAAPAACRRGAPIALLDTAVARDHPSLRGANVAVRSFLREGMRSTAPYHGTAIAALLIGESAPGATPMAPGARLVVAEVIGRYDGEQRGDALGLVKALNWAAETRVRVVALSLEGGANRALHQAIRRLAGRTSIVAAAGNAGPRGDPAFPAAYPEVIAVAAVDARLRPYRNGTRGDYVELAAPGVDILSAGAGGSRQTWTGTSFAVPFAVAAVLRARAITRGDPAAARTLLRREARDLGAPGLDEIYGFGLIQSPGDRCW
ncbi:MAG: S8 family serine peptidase [Pseudomonadota bacterium]